jgi:mRNA-degrading endonuclease RelE of RelBE toxin-antitoxin system
MTFNVEFDERAFKEWNKLEKTIREQFKKKLKKLQQNLMWNQPDCMVIWLAALK